MLSKAKGSRTLKVRYSRQTAVVVECKEVVFVGDEVRAVIDRCCTSKVSQRGTADCGEARLPGIIPLMSRHVEAFHDHFFGGGGLGVPVVS